MKRGKTDANDAEAICEAVTRPKMRFVAMPVIAHSYAGYTRSGAVGAKAWVCGIGAGMSD